VTGALDSATGRTDFAWLAEPDPRTLALATLVRLTLFRDIGLDSAASGQAGVKSLRTKPARSNLDPFVVDGMPGRLGLLAALADVLVSRAAPGDRESRYIL
jgi:hypothetical protein